MRSDGAQADRRRGGRGRRRPGRRGARLRQCRRDRGARARRDPPGAEDGADVETAVALAEQGRTTRGGIPKPLDLALFTREFDDEVRAAFPPRWVQRAALAPLAWLAGRARPGASSDGSSRSVLKRGRSDCARAAYAGCFAGADDSASDGDVADRGAADGHPPRGTPQPRRGARPARAARRRRGRGPRGGPLRFARMTGSSIAGRDAAAWVTDFLNAAYYRRPVAERQVDDLRFAFSVLTTYWYRKGTVVCASPTCPPSTERMARIASTRRCGPGTREPRAAPAGSRRPDRRLVPGRLPRRRAPRLGDRVPDRRGEGVLRPGAPVQAREARRAHAGAGPGRTAGLAHLLARAHAVRRSGHRRADQARDLAGLRLRARPLHAAARRRPARSDVRDRGRGRHRVRPCRSSPAAT